VRALTRVGVALASLLCAGCARNTAGGGAAAPPASSRNAGNALTQQQLAATNAANLYEAIQKLRPEWLTTRGATSVTDATPTTANVYMNGTMLGPVDYLREVHVLDVSEVRYWDAGQASARFGMGHPRGVIELTRK
jgi:hypothetical protein